MAGRSIGRAAVEACLRRDTGASSAPGRPLSRRSSSFQCMAGLFQPISDVLAGAGLSHSRPPGTSRPGRAARSQARPSAPTTWKRAVGPGAARPPALVGGPRPGPRGHRLPGEAPPPPDPEAPGLAGDDAAVGDAHVATGVVDDLGGRAASRTPGPAPVPAPGPATAGRRGAGRPRARPTAPAPAWPRGCDRPAAPVGVRPRSRPCPAPGPRPARRGRRTRCPTAPRRGRPPARPPRGRT